MWWVGGPESDLGVNGRCLRRGEVHGRGSASEGVLEEEFYWGKHIEGKVLQKESNNELH